MKRPYQHVMEDDSGELLRQLLPKEWIVRPLPKDYGVDYEVEIVDQESVTGNRFWVQLKAVGCAKCVSVIRSSVCDTGKEKSIPCVSFSLATKELRYALKCAFPLLLFVADLNQRRIFWIPLRDEVLVNLSTRNKDWGQQKTNTILIPERNQLAIEKQSDYPGLRWYALEPARMYAFATLHSFIHEFGNKGRLSGYSIGDGFIDDGEGDELRESLVLAKHYLLAALSLDVLFGEQGHGLFGTAKTQILEGIKAADDASRAIARNKFTFHRMSRLLGQCGHAMGMLSTVITMYDMCREGYLLQPENRLSNGVSVGSDKA